MFKKPVRIKSNNQVKGSERKAIKDLFCKNFSNVTEEQINALFNNKKEALNCIKLTTHSNEIVQVYTIQKQPLFFSVQGKMLPTVFLLWRLPNLVASFTTHPQVMSFISSGADLMLAGLVTPPPHSGLPRYNSLPQSSPVYVNLSSSSAAVAVGLTALSSYDMERAGGRGKCVLLYHFYGDHLCSVEGNSNIPIPKLPPPEWLSLSDYQADFPALGDNSADAPKLLEVNSNENPQEDPIPAVIEEDPDQPEAMDELLNYCFLAALKYSKSLALPVLISNFFKLQMLPMCPPGPTLDIKRTSHKKVKPFLDAMAKSGLITIQEIRKGVEAVTDINKTHPKFNEFYIKPEDRPRLDSDDAKRQTVVTESYAITHNVLPIFQPAGYHKGDILEVPNIRKCVTEHVKQNNCQVSTNPKLVHPTTAVLKTVCKTENPVSWEEVFEKVCESMKSCFKVSSGNDFSQLNKGKVSPIYMSVSTRSGNKKVTLVDNLEVFGVNIQEFAKECQHGVAASTSITPTPPGKKCDQLLVQGNQVIFIHNLLVDKYKIPKQYIRGLELAPKKRK
ncbi:eukaryotic translation initiation factor 2D [Dendroctonus ponderosae]|uniref:SUI1 domain-containing protein n=1 Tax=Dendroctonus ponderosae TaxID=77166 RepID=U4TZQ4_DENPD|nr:eukaryotic translation initiation factor 2D [Dendroctonus ponderosae]ERL87099.1 hypothetical protein D910_04499 [Dendroctonus ponderosae]